MMAVIYCKIPFQSSTIPLEPAPTVENNTCHNHGNYIHYNCMCIAILTKSSDILNKNSLAVKKCEANQKQNQFVAYISDQKF